MHLAYYVVGSERSVDARSKINKIESMCECENVRNLGLKISSKSKNNKLQRRNLKQKGKEGRKCKVEISGKLTIENMSPNKAGLPLREQKSESAWKCDYSE